MFKNILILVLLAVVAPLAWREYRSATPLGGVSQPWIVLTAYGSQDEAGQWQGEVAPFMNNLVQSVEVSQSVPQCQQAFRGRLYDQDVLVAITGVGKTSAAACTQDLLTASDGHIKGLVFAGTSGISPISGRNTPDTVTMIGDICINAPAVDFDRQFFTSDQLGTSASHPVFSTDKPVGTTFSRVLADHLYELAKQSDHQAPPPEVQTINNLYHGTSRTPVVWGPDECLEVSGDLFWHDTKADNLARQIGANWVQVQPDPVIVTAMESSAVGSVISRWNTAYKTDIPFAYVRSASNFDQPWKNDSGQPAVNGSQSLDTGYTAESRSFAIQSASSVVLKMLQTEDN